MKQQTYMFTIPGNPQNVIRYKNLSHSIRDRYQETRSFYRVNILNQHPSEKIISGPIAIDCLFIFDQQQAKQLSNQKINYHKKFPTLCLLYGFVENIMKGLLFDNEVLVVRLNMMKMYGDKPRTEVLITKL